MSRSRAKDSTSGARSASPAPRPRRPASGRAAAPRSARCPGAPRGCGPRRRPRGPRGRGSSSARVALALDLPQLAADDEAAGEGARRRGDIGLREPPAPTVKSSRRTWARCSFGRAFRFWAASRPREEGGVARDPREERIELAERVAPEEAQPAERDPPVLPRGHGEVAVPEERHLLEEGVRGAHHAPEPPRAEDIRIRAGAVLVGVRFPLERRDVALGCEQPADRAPRASASARSICVQLPPNAARRRRWEARARFHGRPASGS